MAGRPIAVTADSNGVMLLWQLSTGRATGRQIAKLTGPVKALAVTSLSGQPVAVTSSDMGTLMVWNLETGEAVGPPLGRPADGLLRTWDLRSGRLVLRALELPEPIGALAVTGEGDLLVGFGHDIGLLALAPLALEEP